MRARALAVGISLSVPCLLLTGGIASSAASTAHAYGLGTSDFVVGLTGANHGTGAIEVRIHGGTPRVYQPGQGGLPSLPAGSEFGASVAGISINNDTYEDLLVGVPDMTVNGTSQAGAIQELFGSATGFTPGPLITLGTGASGSLEPNSHFGTSISVTDEQVNVGIPGATVLSDDDSTPLAGAGEVVSFSLLSSGQVDQSQPEPTTTMQVPQAGAHFGTIVYGDPTIDEDVITAPDASNGTKTGTGYVEMSGFGVYGQRAGDHLGASLTTGGPGTDKTFGVLAGAPGRTVGMDAGAGAVEWFEWDIDGPVVYHIKTITQASPGVPGRPQPNAHFGASVASSGGLLATRQWSDIIIGAPGHAVAGKRGAGEVVIEKLVEGVSSSGWLGRGWTTLSRASHGVPGVPRVGAHFGASVATVPLSSADSPPQRLMVGIPFAHPVGTPASGAVQVFHLTDDGAVHRDVSAVPRVGGAQPGDQFGAWLGTLD